MIDQIALYLSVVLTAAALVPGGAHVLELRSKMSLGEGDYFTVQSIYRGWALVGIVVIAAFAANVWAAALLRSRGETWWPSALAAGLILATLAVFFTFTRPVNRSTFNWTKAPDDWRRLRRRWEYSHAANAVLTLIALCFSTAAALAA